MVLIISPEDYFFMQIQNNNKNNRVSGGDRNLFIGIRKCARFTQHCSQVKQNSIYPWVKTLAGSYENTAQFRPWLNVYATRVWSHYNVICIIIIIIIIRIRYCAHVHRIHRDRASVRDLNKMFSDDSKGFVLFSRTEFARVVNNSLKQPSRCRIVYSLQTVRRCLRFEMHRS